MTTYILGAGPTGLALVDGLIDAQCDNFVLIEREQVLGGLAKTLSWNSIGAHDLGPHKIFSLDQALIGRVEKLLPADLWLTRDKISSIYMKGRYLPYPPSPFLLSKVFGLPIFTRMLLGYIFAAVRNLFSALPKKTFEDDLVARLGLPLYEELFKPIAFKLWGDPRLLDIKLSQGRIQTPSIFEILGRMLKIKKNSEFEALNFHYPKGGLGKIWDAIARKSKGRGEIRTGETITGLNVENIYVTTINLENNRRINLSRDDMVVSTLPLGLTLRLLGDAVPKRIKAIAQEIIRLNDLILVFFHVDCSSLIEESWVFVPDPEIIFHRLSEQESFDPSMTPNGSVVCCEIMSSKMRNFFSKSDEYLITATRKGLIDMGYTDFHVQNSKVMRLPKSYPVFNTGYEKGLKDILQYTDQFKNFLTVGRQGAFNYIGTLDAMDIGYGVVRWLQQGRQANSWQKERERTSKYPVLD